MLIVKHKNNTAGEKYQKKLDKLITMVIFYRIKLVRYYCLQEPVCSRRGTIMQTGFFYTQKREYPEKGAVTQEQRGKEFVHDLSNGKRRNRMFFYDEKGL